MVELEVEDLTECGRQRHGDGMTSIKNMADLFKDLNKQNVDLCKQLFSNY